MQKLYYYQSLSNYTRALARLQKNIRSGQFLRYTQQKKWQIWNRLCRYARQLGIKIKAPVAAACLAAGLSFATPAAAQTFTQQTGAANPLNAVNVVSTSAPYLVDIDGDGDPDAFIGAYDGTITYYKNTGTAAAAVFTIQTGAANPLNGADVGDYSAPTFVDIDGDGDIDAFIGANNGTIAYYKNTGTAAAPFFTLQTGAANPFNSVDVGDYSIPTFVDIDGDGDFDAFIGEVYGTLGYYKNTGTAAAPVFTLQTGAANPLDGVDLSFATPTFADIDGDGDMDAFIGEYYGTISYY
ncbi:MAG: VCBS repeat-containing protein, partial [Chitinophagaceae bacterium]